MYRIIHDLEIFLDKEIKRLQKEQHIQCEAIIIKAKLASLLVHYGYEVDEK